MCFWLLPSPCSCYNCFIRHHNNYVTYTCISKTRHLTTLFLCEICKIYTLMLCERCKIDLALMYNMWVRLCFSVAEIVVLPWIFNGHDVHFMLVTVAPVPSSNAIIIRWCNIYIMASVSLFHGYKWCITCSQTLLIGNAVSNPGPTTNSRYYHEFLHAE